MSPEDLLTEYQKQSPNKILLIVVDGLGGLAHPEFGFKSELEYARLPNLDAFAQRRETVLGIQYPIARGFIPGSAAGHLALLGYDPLQRNHHIGRGIFEALDLQLPIGPGDIVARLNFATLEGETIADRRAGRLANGAPLAEKLEKEISIPNARVRVISTREHRGVVWIAGTEGSLSSRITDTDPGEVGRHILRCEPRAKEPSPAAQLAADLVNQITKQSLDILQNMEPANAVILRGFSEMPHLEPLSERHGLRPFAIADYPLYRGVARLVGMTLADPVSYLWEKVEQLRENYESYDYFFFHYKEPDARGEDGDFIGKVRSLEAFDEVLPDILRTMNLDRDVILITGDHSTPSLLAAHSHHSVPLALFSSTNKGYDHVAEFNEETCANGKFGRVRGVELMGSVLARSGKLKKFDL